MMHLSDAGSRTRVPVCPNFSQRTLYSVDVKRGGCSAISDRLFVCLITPGDSCMVVYYWTGSEKGASERHRHDGS